MTAYDSCEQQWCVIHSCWDRGPFSVFSQAKSQGAWLSLRVCSFPPRFAGSAMSFPKGMRGEFPGWKPASSSVERGRSRVRGGHKPEQKDAQDETIARLSLTIAKLTEEVAALRAQLEDKVKGNSNDEEKVNVSEKVKLQNKPSARRASEDGAWKVVTKKRIEKEGVPAAKVHSKLRAEDWQVPVVEISSLRDGSNGIALASQKDGEKVFREMNLCKGSMGILTPKPIEGESEEIEVLVRKPNGETDVVKKFLTNVGDIPVQHDQKDELSAVTLKIQNKTKKLVLQMHKQYSSEQEYEAAKRVPKLILEKWLADHGLKKGTININTPFIRKVGNAEWIETIIYAAEISVGHFLASSGKRGVFINPYYDRDNIDDGSLVKIYFEKGTTLADALSRTARHSNMVVGLVCNATGVGARVNAVHYDEMLDKLLTPEGAVAARKRKGQKFYQLSKVPPWVDFDDVKDDLKAHFKWDIDLVRIGTRYGSKIFIIKAGDPPPKDYVIIQHHKVPIQLAPERSKPEMERMELKRHSNADAAKKSGNRRVEDRPVNLVADAPRDQTRREEVKPKGNNEDLVMSEVRKTFEDFTKMYQQEFDKMKRGFVGMREIIENTRQDIHRDIADFKSEVADRLWKQDAKVLQARRTLEDSLRRVNFEDDGVDNLSDIDIDVDSDGDNDPLKPDRSDNTTRKRKGLVKGKSGKKSH